MEEKNTRIVAGIDFGRRALQFSIYDISQPVDKLERMTKTAFLPIEEGDSYISAGLLALRGYLHQQEMDWDTFERITFSMEDASEEYRRELTQHLGKEFFRKHQVTIINRFHSFVEYVFHQEQIIWDRNTILFDYNDERLLYTKVEQISYVRQRYYRAVTKEIDLVENGIPENEEEKDAAFCKMIKQFLLKNPVQVIYLTGEGFEGNWMKKTRTCLCAGRRVFFGQHIYSDGACYHAIEPAEMLEKGMVLMLGEEMIHHTVGLLTVSGTKRTHTPITSIGKEWYNTKGSVDIILDKSNRVDFFYHDATENMMQSNYCELKDLPKRPPKTTRVRVSVQFTGPGEGRIMIRDLGFGALYPATNKVTVFPFSLIR